MVRAVRRPKKSARLQAVFEDGQDCLDADTNVKLIALFQFSSVHIFIFHNSMNTKIDTDYRKKM